MFKKLVIKKEYENSAIEFPEPINKLQHTGTSNDVVFYNGEPDDLFIGTAGFIGEMVRPFSIMELSTMNPEFLKYFDAVDYELTDEDVELAKAKIKEENNPLGNLLLSLLEIAEELVESIEESLEDEDVDEPLYYIVLPKVYEDDAYLNYDNDVDEITFDDSYQSLPYQTKFTQKEINNLFPEYDAFKVEVSK